MVDSVSAFIAYHAAVGQFLPEHFNFPKEKCVPNRIDISDTKDQCHTLFQSLIDLLSHQED